MDAPNERSMAFDGVPPTAEVTGTTSEVEMAAVADVVDQHSIFTFNEELQAPAERRCISETCRIVDEGAGGHA